uniref:Uncharacterized protein n=2 Tax=Brassica oleracea TaxID=3712 RepID=A0A0D3CCZ0_BRAOL|nr:unnamed protein product [Brassica oleracea]
MTHFVLRLRFVNLKRRSVRGGIWKAMTKEAPRCGFHRADHYIAGAGKLLKTWRPLIVLIMVIFQEDTCLLSVSHAARTSPTVIILRALLPYTVNPSTAHHRCAHATRTVIPQLATDPTIKLCYTYISYVFFYGSFHIYACVIPNKIK